MTHDQLVEEVAKTICLGERRQPDRVPAINHNRDGGPVDDSARPAWMDYRETARAILSLIHSHLSEVTPEMDIACKRAMRTHFNSLTAEDRAALPKNIHGGVRFSRQLKTLLRWHAMLAASPLNGEGK